MRPEHDDVGVRVFLAERAPRLLRHREVGIETVVPFGKFALNRVMHQVTGDHRVLPLRRNSHAVMAGSVAGGRLEAYFIRKAKFLIDQVGNARVDDRPHRVLDRIAHVLAVERREEIPLGAANQVACVRKRRHPLAVLERRVPSDVIDVQMRADNAIDLVGAVSRFFQIAQKRQLEVAPHRVRSDLVVADAGIDDDAFSLRLDDQGMDTHPELALLVGKNRIEPVRFLLDVLGSGVRQYEGARPWRLALDYSGYLDVADIELIHRSILLTFRSQLSPISKDSPSVNIWRELRYSYSRTNAFSVRA